MPMAIWLAGVVVTFTAPVAGASGSFSDGVNTAYDQRFGGCHFDGVHRQHGCGWLYRNCSSDRRGGTRKLFAKQSPGHPRIPLLRRAARPRVLRLAPPSARRWQLRFMMPTVTPFPGRMSLSSRPQRAQVELLSVARAQQLWRPTLRASGLHQPSQPIPP